MEESELNMAKKFEEEILMGDVLSVTSTDLGEGNLGGIGPAVIDDSIRSVIDQEIENSEYHYPVKDNEWWCVVGRLRIETSKGDRYPAQIAGSIPVSETAAEYMTNSSPAPISQVIADKTQLAVSDGLEVVVHGDSGHGKTGCAANKLDRDILRSNAANIDQVAPRTLAIGKLAGLDLDRAGLTEDDIVGLISQGGKASDDDKLFDASTEEKIDIMVNNGAKYEELSGDHQEKKVVVVTDPETTFNGTAFAQTHANDDGSQDEVFVASVATYVELAYERGKQRGLSETEIAKQCFAVIAFNIGVAKQVGNQNLEAAILARQ